MGDDNRKLENDSRLTHWRSLYETALHSDRVAADIGVFVLKVVMVINGAALIALLAVIPEFRPIQGINADFINGVTCFFWGLLVAALASGISYFYHSFVTARDCRNLHEAYGKGDAPFALVTKLVKPTIAVVTALVIGSYVLFAFGGYAVLRAVAT